MSPNLLKGLYKDLVGGATRTKAKMTPSNYRIMVVAHVVLFILFLSILPENSIVGVERLVASYIITLLLIFAITGSWMKSSWIAFLFVIILGFLDERGLFSDITSLFHKQNESFDDLKDLKPAGRGTGPTDIKPGNTKDMDNTGITEDDLDKILAADYKVEEDGDRKQKEAFNEAGGGLEGLTALLKQAREESQDSKSPDDYTPAQAQRETHRLIDTVEQLKTTMTEMLPLMKSGNNLIQLYQKMGGKDLTKAFQ